MIQIKQSESGCGNCCHAIIPYTPADAAEGGVADKVVVLALARRVAVLAPVSLGAELLAARAGVAGAALAAAVHRVAGGLVVAVALVRAVRPEGPEGARLAAVLAHPAAGTAALAVHVVALAIVLKFGA